MFSCTADVRAQGVLAALHCTATSVGIVHDVSCDVSWSELHQKVGLPPFTCKLTNGPKPQLNLADLNHRPNVWLSILSRNRQRHEHHRLQHERHRRLAAAAGALAECDVVVHARNQLHARRRMSPVG